MARTMSDERERELRTVYIEGPYEDKTSHADTWAELDAERAAHALTRASIKTCDVCGEETSTWEGHALKAALADERRHADALLNALHNPDNITVERAIEAHHARRAAAAPLSDAGASSEVAND